MHWRKTELNQSKDPSLSTSVSTWHKRSSSSAASQPSSICPHISSLFLCRCTLTDRLIPNKTHCFDAWQQSIWLMNICHYVTKHPIHAPLTPHRQGNWPLCPVLCQAKKAVAPCYLMRLSLTWSHGIRSSHQMLPAKLPFQKRFLVYIMQFSHLRSLLVWALTKNQFSQAEAPTQLQGRGTPALFPPNHVHIFSLLWQLCFERSLISTWVMINYHVVSCKNCLLQHLLFKFSRTFVACHSPSLVLISCNFCTVSKGTKTFPEP